VSFAPAFSLSGSCSGGFAFWGSFFFRLGSIILCFFFLDRPGFFLGFVGAIFIAKPITPRIRMVPSHGATHWSPRRYNALVAAKV
jgi:hypothetical protein